MIKNRLRVLLAEREMNLRQLAEMAGIHYTTIHRFAADDTTLIHKPTLDKICSTLEVTPGDIFIYRTAEPTNANNPTADFFTD